jgi:glycine hydroxymethyltransferase
MNLKKTDKKIYKLLQEEQERQRYKIQLIPSENYTSKAVREAVGSIIMHKYSEGQIGERYYEGNQIVDKIETLCKERIRTVFKLPKDWHVNVQALAGSNANLAVYNALLKPGDTILSMYLPDGGHLSHGWSWPDLGLSGEIDKRIYEGGKKIVSLVSKYYKIVQYKVDKKSRLFDYNEIRKIALKIKPQLIISGGTAYPREINYKKLSSIAKEVKSYYLADIAHEAGLIAAGVNTSPVGIADVITMTTQKTLRGPRGSIILSRGEFAESIDKSVFPGIQGGPFDNNIAGITVCVGEALTKEFKMYAQQVVKNAQVLANELIKYNFDVLTGGTDKHLIVIDLRNKNLFVGPKHKNLPGQYIARAIDTAGITLNKNTVPFETGNAVTPSGIRLGTPTVTTRGMKEKEMKQIAYWINKVVETVRPYITFDFKNFQSKVERCPEIIKTRKEVKNLCKQFPLPD